MVVVLVTGAIAVAVVQDRLAYERLDGKLERLMLTLEGVMRTEFGEGLDLTRPRRRPASKWSRPIATLLLVRPGGELLEVFASPYDVAMPLSFS